MRRMGFNEAGVPQLGALLLAAGTGFIGGHLRRALGRPPILVLRRDRSPLSEERWACVDLSRPVKGRLRQCGLEADFLLEQVHKAGFGELSQQEML